MYAEDYDDTEAPPLPPFMKPVPPPTSAPAFVDRTKHIVREIPYVGVVLNYS